MKTIFALFAFCLVAINANVIGETAVNYEVIVNEILSEIDQLTKEASDALKHHMEDMVLDPLYEIERAVQHIDNLRVQSAACVDAHYEKVITTVSNMHEDIGVCTNQVAKASAQIMIDIHTASHQLVFDGYDVITTYRKCRKYENSLLQKSCYATLAIKGGLYMNNARDSYSTIKQIRYERIPAFMVDTCTQAVATNAAQELDRVNVNVDICIGL